MTHGKMFVAQMRINEAALYTILADIVLAYILKRVGGPRISAPLLMLYFMNVVVLVGVYRFWKFPVFSWDETGFVFFGLNPFKRDVGLWKSVDAAGFKSIENKKGRMREYLMVVYTSPKGVSKTGLVPMDMVGFPDAVRQEMEKFLKHKGIKKV
ncbi:MAG: hypothetical protein HZC51_09120 [Nitrospirae bacterium]|nr:hypothetical protein [Nitrospirota bacterium]